MTLVQSEPKKIYIRVEQTKREPWANTLAYYKFDGNLSDSSWNWYDLSGIPYWYTTWLLWQALHSTSNKELQSTLKQSQIFSWPFAIAFCAEMLNSNTIQRIVRAYWDLWIDLQYEFYNDFSGFQVYNNATAVRIAFPLTNPWIWVWKKIVVTWDGVNQVELYVDGTKITPYPDYNTTFVYPSPNYPFKIAWVDNADMALDEFIVENKYRTQADVNLYLALFN